MPEHRLDGGPDRLRLPRRDHEVEVERHDLVQVLAVVGGPLREIEDVDLPDGERLMWVLVENRLEFPVRLMDIGMSEVVEMDEVVVLPHVLPGTGAVAGRRRVVPLPGVLHHLMGGIHPEPVDSQVQPEPCHVEHRLPDLRVPPVQVGLMSQERMPVVLAGFGVEGPGRPAEHAHPVVGRGTIGLRVAPHIPVPLGVVP